MQPLSRTPRAPDPVTSIEVHWRRVHDNDTRTIDYEWTKLGVISPENRSLDWNFKGKYVFRAVPFHAGQPLEGFEEYEFNFPEPEGLDWTYCQLKPHLFNVRFEGIVGTNVNHVKLLEGNRLLRTVPLRPDASGRVEVDFPLGNLSKRNPSNVKLKF